MIDTVKSFQDLTPDLWVQAGGKGGMLARMYQGRYPVPEGFVILPSAFQEDKLTKEVWSAIRRQLNDLRKKNPEVRFAVRSSALSEDSASASFAGEFETVLNVETDDKIAEAIDAVYKSKHSERVLVYSSVQGFQQSHQIAVVVQQMIPSEISGVLFTADPITGSYATMTGNFVYGIGEQLVSGEANAYSFEFFRPKGKYEGPEEFKKYATELFRIAAKLESEFGGPQDIEWAVAHGKLYILQARPITTLRLGNLDTYEWNESLSQDFLWTNTNIGEAIPDVMTPLTWTAVRSLDEEQNLIPGYYVLSGNICGRAYTNISMAMSVYPILGFNAKKAAKLVSEALGEIPDGVKVPTYPFSRWGLLRAMFPKVRYYFGKIKDVSKNMQEHMKSNPERCLALTVRIQKIKKKEELLSLWKGELQPLVFKSWWALLMGGRKYGRSATKLNEELAKLVGGEEANTLMSNLRGDSGLASLGPVIGISKVIQGKMSREEYLKEQGHRGPHEFELSIPHPAEDENWLEKQIRDYKTSNTDVDGLLEKQQVQYEKAWKRFVIRFPQKKKDIEQQLTKCSEHAQLREAARSEFIRAYRLIRVFALKAGELTGIGEDVFFLYLDEVEKLLSKEDLTVKHISARKETYNKYKALPPYPTLIRGRFDPFKWSENPDRRVDCYDPTLPVAVAPDSETLKGYAGAAGRVEGTVRILFNPEEGDKLKPGEILVASTTNVGWTPLFPRTAAIITDIGAPLSHAAIVARELGIPAVVGCGNATTRLKTGDRVIVAGGQGVVQILSSGNS